MERAAKVSGSRFAYRVGDVALVELALYRYALGRLVEKGFVPVLPPVLVREDAMYGTGFLPTDEVNIYRVERDELYLTGTAEVGLASMHMEEILDEDALPIRYVGFSTNFRREAGAAGKDTRGMFRVHLPGARGRGARPAARGRGGADRRSRHPIPGRQHRRGGPRRLGDQEVRHRGLVPGTAAVPRAHVDVEHDGLPVAAARHPRAAREWARARLDPERHRGDGALDARDPGELPGGGRRGRDSRAALGLRRAAAVDSLRRREDTRADLTRGEP